MMNSVTERENKMITKTSEKQLVRAIKARLGLNDRKAREIIDENWFSMPTESLRDCVLVVHNAEEVNPYLDVMVQGLEGYSVWVASLRLKPSDLERWKKMPIEQAYSLPEDFRTIFDSYEWSDGRVVNVRPRDEDAIIVTVEDNEGFRLETAMLAEINDAPGLVTYAMEKLDRGARLCIERNPQGERADKAKGLPILEMICAQNDSVELDEYFGTPESMAA